MWIELQAPESQGSYLFWSLFYIQCFTHSKHLVNIFCVLEITEASVSKLGLCYGLNISPPNSDVEILMSIMVVLGGRSFERGFVIRGIQPASFIRTCVLIKETLQRFREKAQVMDLEVGLCHALLPRSWTSLPPEQWEIKFCCL